MGDRVDLPAVQVRRWDGDEWPDKRVSLALGKPCDAAVFVSARYQLLDDAQELGEEIAHRCNVHRELVEALEATKANLELARMHFDGDASSMMFDSIQNAEAVLAKVRGE